MWWMAMVFTAGVMMADVTSDDSKTMGDFRAMITQRAQEHAAELKASRFSRIRDDYFARYSRDETAVPEENETAIATGWKVVLSPESGPLAELMAGHLVEFLSKAMGLDLPVERTAGSVDEVQAIILLDSGGGDASVLESFTIRVEQERVKVVGCDPAGLRDGIVRLVDCMGFRQAPILERGSRYIDRAFVSGRGAHGSLRDTVFMGYNAILAGGGSLYAASTSDAIPQLAARRVPDALAGSYATAKEARQYEMKTYFHMGTQEKFGKGDPIFDAHPEIRGALTWKEDGDYTLCTEHPLVQQFIAESVAGIFRGDPELDGITIIVGGEGFYHCYMRPYGVAKGHTNCARCEPLGAETVVANLCNLVATAARGVNPAAEVMAWPYSAAHVWSTDKAQTEFIERLKPGVTILTEMVKDEVIEKPEGIRKALWDYSIDMIGPGERAQQQIAACNSAGVPIRVLSMAEETFEASLLPHIPCLDRWADRAEALASNGIDSVYVWQMGPYDATSAAEINRFFWWDPVPGKEELLQRFAARIGGTKARPHIRDAWRYVSEAIDFSPEIGPYYQGPHYLGPMHPMCAEPEADLPQVFYGYYLFYAEMTADEAFKGRPTFHVKPRGDAPVFERYYQRMAERLKQAADEMDRARALVPEQYRLMFDAEDLPVQWFYRTARTEANFYASCRLRDQLLAWCASPPEKAELKDKVEKAYRQWRAVLLDEQANVTAAVPIMAADVRLDPYHRGDHSLARGMDMLKAKLALLEHELDVYLPAVAKRCGLEVD